MASSSNSTQFEEPFTPNEDSRKLIDLWEAIGLTELLKQKNKNGDIFDFVDGPPFVSASFLHMGHMLISTLKSIYANWFQMHGKYVDNKKGYDCHGLPIEMVVGQLLDVFTKQQIETFGIDNYNAKCKSIIKEYSGSWTPIFDMVGRFGDPLNEYKTMDTPFMESVWWVFSQLYQKNLVYMGCQVMPFSTGCCTSLSNFEATQNYETFNDVTLYVLFPLKSDFESNVSFVAWTTTPWTLVSNLALCVNPNLIYAKVRDVKNNKIYIMCVDTIKNVFDLPKKQKQDQLPYEILETFLGSTLEGVEYFPPFTYFNNKEFRVICGDFVTNESGTGVVHIAPAFGEEDFNVSIKYGVVDKTSVLNYCPVDDSGKFTDIIYDMVGQYVMDPNTCNEIVSRLHKSGKLVKKQMYEHSCPVCWRTNTRLIYKVVPSIFIRATELKEKMIANNNKINWSPAHVGKGRFNNWLETTCDWGVSRPRFFGTPIPMWISDDGEEIVCVGSIQELSNLSGTPLHLLTDIHREFIDHIEIPSNEGRGMLKRIPYVYDCWFESGCVPYGQIHYPFENNANYFDDKEFLSEFVTEGIDQTRGWFYTLLVLSTALFDKPPFKNVICCGLVLDETGKKISKKLGNFVHPITILQKYGADAVRLYLAGSPAAHGESFKFVGSEIEIIGRKLYQLYNGVKFFLEHYTNFIKDGGTFDPNSYLNSDNITDRWILSRVQTTVNNIDHYINLYTVHKVTSEILLFIEDLINWYIKLNRNRLNGRISNSEDRNCALSTLYKVLITMCKMCAPFIPFLTEKLYQKLKSLDNNNMQEVDQVSIHLSDYPKSDEFVSNTVVEHQMVRLQQVCYMARLARSRSINSQSVKIPLKLVRIASENGEYLNDVLVMEQYLREEVNVINIEYTSQDNLVNYRLVPNFKKLGTTYKHLSKLIIDELKHVDSNLLAHIRNGIIETITVTVNNIDYILGGDDFTITVDSKVNVKETELYVSENDTIVIIDTEFDDQVLELYIKRLFVSNVQAMRKKAGLRPWNKINIYYNSDNDIVNSTLVKYKDEIKNDLGFEINNMASYTNSEPVIIISDLELHNYKVNVLISKS